MYRIQSEAATNPLLYCCAISQSAPFFFALTNQVPVCWYVVTEEVGDVYFVYRG